MQPGRFKHGVFVVVYVDHDPRLAHFSVERFAEQVAFDLYIEFFRKPVKYHPAAHNVRRTVKQHVVLFFCARIGAIDRHGRHIDRQVVQLVLYFGIL